MVSFRYTRYLTSRVPIVLALILVGVLLHTNRRPAAELSERALVTQGELGWRLRAAEFLSRTHDIWVEPTAVTFLPIDQIPAWHEAFHFVPVVFTSRSNLSVGRNAVASPTADLFYVELAMNSAGVPIDSRRLTNLSRTSLADEVVIGSWQSVVAVSTSVHGRIQSIQLLDFNEDFSHAVSRADVPGWLGRLMIRIDNRRATGRVAGIDRREFLVLSDVDRLDSALAHERLDVVLHDGSTLLGRARFDLATRQLAEGSPLLDELPPRVRVATNLWAWLTELMRGYESIGPERVAVIERVASRLPDDARLLLVDATAFPDSRALETAAHPPWLTGFPTFATRDGVPADVEWPPPAIVQPLDFTDDLSLEGEWIVASPDWVQSLAGAPPAILQTFIRTDPERPYSWVLALAVDMTQFELSFEQGVEEPASETGRRGAGRLPNDSDALQRLVAVFSGGIQSHRAPSGSVLDGVVFAEPRPGQATLAWTGDSDAIRVGTWGNQASVVEGLPGNISTLRQSLPPIVVNGELNPELSRQTNDAVASDNMATRSGMCVRGERTLMYFWSQRVTLAALSYAMVSAGCEYGLHLAMAPAQTGFRFVHADGPDSRVWPSALPTSEMTIGADRFVANEPNDFFYLLSRRTFDRSLPAVDGQPWQTAEMPMSSEGFLPLVASLALDAGAVRLFALDLDHVDFTFSLPTEAPQPGSVLGYRVNSVRDLGAVRFFLGVDANDSSRGLTVDGKELVSPRGEGLWLVVSDEQLRVVEETNPAASTRLELVDPDNLTNYHGVCGAVGNLPDSGALVVAFGPVVDVGRRLDQLSVTNYGVLGCGRRAPKLEAVDAEPGGWFATDLVASEARHVETLWGPRSGIAFSATERPARIQRLDWAE